MAKDNDIYDDSFMDDSFDPMDSSGNNNKKRGVVDHVVDGAKTVGSKFISFDAHTEAIQEALDKSFDKSSMSREYNDIKDFITETADNIGTQYDDVKKGVSDLAKSVKSIVPDVLGLKELIGKFIDDDGGYKTESEAARKEREILESVSGTLGSIEEFQKKIEESENYGKDKTKESTNDILKEIAASSHFSKVYQTEYTSKYYRKSLELQYRQTMLLKDLLTLNQTMAVDNKNFLGGILKNTSLPDILKQRTMEMMGNDIKVKLRSSFLDSFVFNKNIFKELGVNINNRIKEYGSSIKDQVSMLGMSASQIAEFKEQFLSSGIDATDMIKDSIATGAVNQTHKFFIPRLLNKILSTETGGKILGNIRRFYDSPSNYFNYLYGKTLEREGQGKGNFFNSIGKFLFGELSQLARVNNNTAKITFNQEDLNATASFDFRTRKSINTVIPGLLSMIVSETKATRLGYKDFDVTHLMPKYDYIADRFTTSKNIKQELKRRLGEVTRDRTDISKLKEAFNGEKYKAALKRHGISLDNHEIDILSRAAARVSLDVPHEGLELFKSNDFYKALPDNLKKKYKGIIDALTDEYNTANFKDGTAETVDNFRYAVYSARNSIPNAFKYIEDRIKAGDIKELLEMGILKRDENDEDSISFDRKMAIKFMFNEFGLSKEHLDITSRDDKLKALDLDTLKQIGKEGFDLGKSIIGKGLSYLPEKVEKNINNIASAITEDISKLTDSTEQKLFDGIERLDKYIQTKEYEKLPEQTKDKILATKEAAINKLETYYSTGKGKLKEKFTKKNVKGFFKSIGSYFTKQKAIDFSKATKDGIAETYKKYSEAYKNGGIKNVGTTFKGSAIDSLNTLNEKTLKAMYNKLPSDVRENLEKASGDKKALLTKDYYVNVLSAVNENIPQSYREKIFENKLSKGLASGFKAVSNSNTVKALGEAMSDIKDYGINKYNNSTIVAKAKETYEKMGISKKELKDKLDLIEMINDAVAARNPKLLDEVEELARSYNYDKDPLIADNIKAGRDNMDRSVSFAGKAFDYLKQVTDPVEYSTKAAKLMGSFWNYVPAGALIKLAGMGIGGYFKLLRKADRWVRDKMFMGGIKTLLKPAWGLTKNAVAGVGGAGLWTLGNLLSSDKLEEIGMKGMSYTGRNIKSGASKAGTLLKGGLGLGVALPLSLMWNAARIGTGTVSHLLGLDHLNPFPWLGRKIYNGIWGKKDPTAKPDGKIKFLFKKGYNGIKGFFKDDVEEQERKKELDEKLEQLFKDVEKAVANGEMTDDEAMKILDAAMKKDGSESDAVKAMDAVEKSEVTDKKKSSIIRRLLVIFRLRKRKAKNFLGKMKDGIMSGLSKLRSFGSRVANKLSKLKSGIKSGFSKAKGKFMDFFHRKDDSLLGGAKISGHGKLFFDSLTALGKRKLKKEAQRMKMDKFEYIEAHYNDVVSRYSDEIKDKENVPLVNGRVKGAADPGAKKSGPFSWLKSILTKGVGFLGILAIKALPLFGKISDTISSFKEEFFGAKGWIRKAGILAKSFTKALYTPIKWLIYKPLMKLCTIMASRLFTGDSGIDIDINKRGKRGIFSKLWRGSRNALKFGLNFGLDMLSYSKTALVKAGEAAVNAGKAIASTAGKFKDAAVAMVKNGKMYYDMVVNKLGSAAKSFCTFVGDFLKNPSQVLGKLLPGAKNIQGKKLAKKAIMKITTAVVRTVLKWVTAVGVSAAATAYFAGAGGVITGAIWLCTAGYGAITAYLAGSTLLGCVIAAVLGFDPLREIFGVGDPEMTATEDDEINEKTKDVKLGASDSIMSDKTQIKRSDEFSNLNTPKATTGQQPVVYNNYNTTNNNVTNDQSLYDGLNSNHKASMDLKERQLELMQKQYEETARMNALMEKLADINNKSTTTYGGSTTLGITGRR